MAQKYFHVGRIATRAGGKRLEPCRAYPVSDDDAKALANAQRGQVVSAEEAAKINQAAAKADKESAKAEADKESAKAEG